MKECTKCKKEKPLTEYRKRGDGFRGACRCCCNKQLKQQRDTNRDSFLKTRAAYIESNKDEIAEYQKQYRKTNKNKLAKTNKEWRKKNKDSIAKSKKEYHAKRYKSDPAYRSVCNLRRRMLLSLSGQNKSASTLELIGCTPDELRGHIESQFTNGISWDNYGVKGWHIDHIIPCASFDLTDPEQQKECFHYTNLQPLWAEDNLKKSDKLPYELTA